MSQPSQDESDARPEGGARFEAVRKPAAQSGEIGTPVVMTAPAPGAPCPGILPTIFVVDDDLSFRTSVERLLRAAGFVAQSFASVGAFLRFATGDTPGCAIVDLRMPGSGGFELQAALEKTGNPLPVIFLTGHGDIPTSVRAMRGGAVDFLTKPVKKDALLDAVHRALVLDAAKREERVRLQSLRQCYELLTLREREVLAHVVAGQLNKQIAADLGTSERTIKAHRAAIMDKLALQSVAELVRLAEQMGVEPVGCR